MSEFNFTSKKNIILILIIYFSYLPSYAQQENCDYFKKLVDRNYSSVDARLKYVMRREFSKLINTNTSGVIGNYVGFSTKDNQLSFAYNFIREKSAIEINLSGKIDNDIAEVFSESKFKTGINLGLKYNRFLGLKDGDIAIEDEINKIQFELDKLLGEYNLFRSKYKSEGDKLQKEIKDKELAYEALKKKRKLLYAGEGESALDKTNEKFFSTQKAIIESEIKQINFKLSDVTSTITSKLKELSKRRANIPNPTRYDIQQFYIDSLKIVNLPIDLKIALDKKKEELNKINKKIKENTFSQEAIDKVEQNLKTVEIELKMAQRKYKNFKDSALNQQNDTYEEKRCKLLTESFDKIRVRKLKLRWISIGGMLSNESYNIFDSSKSFDNQVSKEDDLIPSLSISFSHFSNNSINENNKSKIKFFTIGASLKYGNNSNSLSMLELVTTDSIAPNRFTEKTQKVFSGELEKEIITSRIFSDYYGFGSESNIGYHIRVTADIGPEAPVVSIRGGILLAAIKKGGISSLLNFELFYGLNDILKDGGEGTILSRNILGLQTTIPLNFKL